MLSVLHKDWDRETGHCIPNRKVDRSEKGNTGRNMVNLFGRSVICLTDLCVVFSFLMVSANGGKIMFFVLVCLLECVQASCFRHYIFVCYAESKNILDDKFPTVSDKLAVFYLILVYGSRYLQ